MRGVLPLVAAVLILAGSSAAQQPTGTGRITGQVVAADNGAPVKRAHVTLIGRPMPATPPPAGTTASGGATIMTSMTAVNGLRQDAPNEMTDDAGRFEFGDLAPGRYTLMVMPQGGFVRPMRPYTVEVKDAAAQITVKLERTGAIMGRVLDESGDPLVRARVSAVRKGTVARGGMSSASTDDRGEFRIFDVAPGEYFVNARQENYGFGPAAMKQVQGYAATYYPGVASLQGAQAVTVRSGQDTAGVDFSLVRVALGRITGTVRDASGNLVGRNDGNAVMANVSLQSRRTDGLGEGRGSSFNPDGTFTISAIPPGEYYLTANLQRGPGPESAREGAYVPVTVNGDEQQVNLRMNLGATISGHVTIEGTPPPPPSGLTRPANMAPPRISIGTRPPPGVMSFGMVNGGRPITVAEDGSFEITGARGPVMLTAFGGGPVLKSISHGADDLLAKPLELKGTERVANVSIVMTWDYGRLEGIAMNDRGEPAREAIVLLFPEDASKWRLGQPFVQQTGTIAETMTPPPAAVARGAKPRVAGSFLFPPVLPGRYYIVAVEGGRDMSFSPADEETLTKLQKVATTVTVSTGAPIPIQLRAIKSF
jgi:carboxypeptidase family protein